MLPLLYPWARLLTLCPLGTPSHGWPLCAHPNFLTSLNMQRKEIPFFFGLCSTRSCCITFSTFTLSTFSSPAWNETRERLKLCTSMGRCRENRGLLSMFFRCVTLLIYVGQQNTVTLTKVIMIALTASVKTPMTMYTLQPKWDLFIFFPPDIVNIKGHFFNSDESNIVIRDNVTSGWIGRIAQHHVHGL